MVELGLELGFWYVRVLECLGGGAPHVRGAHSKFQALKLGIG
jgi:hypothetical protein